jgi:hypothetical protein
VIEDVVVVVVVSVVNIRRIRRPRSGWLANRDFTGTRTVSLSTTT